MFAWCRSREVPVHISVFEPGFLRVALTHLAADTLPELVKIQLYFGGHVPFGLPPTLPSLHAYVAMLDGSGLAWMVGVIGGNLLGTDLAAAAIELGGHLRVGLEDSNMGCAIRNEDLVIAASDLVRATGHELATPDAARSLFARS